jgi:hypothetical protein
MCSTYGCVILLTYTRPAWSGLILVYKPEKKPWPQNAQNAQKLKALELYFVHFVRFVAKKILV